MKERIPFPSQACLHSSTLKTGRLVIRQD